MYGWSEGGVNYVLIFGLNPRDRLTYWHIALVGTTLGVFWCSGLLTYLIISSRYISEMNFPIYILPIILNVCLFLFFIIRFGSNRISVKPAPISRIYQLKLFGLFGLLALFEIFQNF